MHLALVASSDQPIAFDIQQRLSRWLTDKRITHACYTCTSPSKDICASDIVVSIGGDGSLLRLVHYLTVPCPPIIGINVGTLGFLTEISQDQLFDSFEAICSGSYTISKRMLLTGWHNDQPIGFAVNDITMHRGSFPHLVDISLHADDAFVTTFSADGLIVATPSGSTAYSLSCGGPIVTPELRLMVVTPICPHAISHRPLVMMPNDALVIQTHRGPDSIDICFDGQQTFTLHKGHLLHIKKYEYDLELIALPINNYFATIRSKLHWTGSLRV